MVVIRKEVIPLSPAGAGCGCDASGFPEASHAAHARYRYFGKSSADR
jgi:hypothetical protein